MSGAYVRIHTNHGCMSASLLGGGEAAAGRFAAPAEEESHGTCRLLRKYSAGLKLRGGSSKPARFVLRLPPMLLLSLWRLFGSPPWLSLLLSEDSERGEPCSFPLLSAEEERGGSIEAAWEAAWSS